MRHAALAARLALAGLPLTGPALAWGDEGHAVVGLIARAHLTPAARDAADALLASDAADALTAPDFVSRTAWADRWRDSDRRSGGVRYRATREWHFVDQETDAPDLAAACFGSPPLAPGTPASAGPARACVVDKVEQFAAELADPTQPQAERVLALKFLLHLVGDVHQPLHAADRHDRGGNEVAVLYGRRTVGSALHAYWDTGVLRRIGHDPVEIAAGLERDYADRLAAWSTTDVRAWAGESFEVARRVAYALPASGEPDAHGAPAYRLDAAYEAAAEAAAREQLAKAGFRLAALLNAALR